MGPLVVFEKVPRFCVLDDVLREVDAKGCFGELAGLFVQGV